MKRGPVDIQLKEAQLSHAVYEDIKDLVVYCSSFDKGQEADHKATAIAMSIVLKKLLIDNTLRHLKSGWQRSWEFDDTSSAYDSKCVNGNHLLLTTMLVAKPVVEGNSISGFAVLPKCLSNNVNIRNECTSSAYSQWLTKPVIVPSLTNDYFTREYIIKNVRNKIAAHTDSGLPDELYDLYINENITTENHAFSYNGKKSPKEFLYYTIRQIAHEALKTICKYVDVTKLTNAL